MAIFDQDGSGRSELTEKTLECLLNTVDFNTHKLVLIDNDSCIKTKTILAKFAGHFSAIGEYNQDHLTIISNEENIGTARAINQGIKMREPDQFVLKMDNDIIINSINWIEEMEEALRRNPMIGILGLKRKDLIETPWNPDINWRSELIMLPHKPGETWMVFEKVKGVMGTCTLYNHALLDKVGYLYQPSLYGYDDSLISGRSGLAGFINGFLPHINIDHIDPGGTFYQKWKEDEAGLRASEAQKIMGQYISGERDIYERCE